MRKVPLADAFGALMTVLMLSHEFGQASGVWTGGNLARTDNVS
jgi:hypothetical protein